MTGRDCPRCRPLVEALRQAAMVFQAAGQTHAAAHCWRVLAEWETQGHGETQ